MDWGETIIKHLTISLKQSILNLHSLTQLKLAVSSTRSTLHWRRFQEHITQYIVASGLIAFSKPFNFEVGT